MTSTAIVPIAKNAPFSTETNGPQASKKPQGTKRPDNSAKTLGAAPSGNEVTPSDPKPDSERLDRPPDLMRKQYRTPAPDDGSSPGAEFAPNAEAEDGVTQEGSDTNEDHMDVGFQHDRERDEQLAAMQDSRPFPEYVLREWRLGFPYVKRMWVVQGTRAPWLKVFENIDAAVKVKAKARGHEAPRFPWKTFEVQISVLARTLPSVQNPTSSQEEATETTRKFVKEVALFMKRTTTWGIDVKSICPPDILSRMYEAIERSKDTDVLELFGKPTNRQKDVLCSKEAQDAFTKLLSNKQEDKQDKRQQIAALAQINENVALMNDFAGVTHHHHQFPLAKLTQFADDLEEAEQHGCTQDEVTHYYTVLLKSWLFRMGMTDEGAGQLGPLKSQWLSEKESDDDQWLRVQAQRAIVGEIEMEPENAQEESHTMQGLVLTLPHNAGSPEKEDEPMTDSTQTYGAATDMNQRKKVELTRGLPGFRYKNTAIDHDAAGRVVPMDVKKFAASGKFIVQYGPDKVKRFRLLGASGLPPDYKIPRDPRTTESWIGTSKTRLARLNKEEYKGIYAVAYEEDGTGLDSIDPLCHCKSYAGEARRWRPTYILTGFGGNGKGEPSRYEWHDRTGVRYLHGRGKQRVRDEDGNTHLVLEADVEIYEMAKSAELAYTAWKNDAEEKLE
ncbi:hypothetical protein LTS18_013414 [Coniosporium uncinatum]|uniref:Uncharacterized protein n=1 Tax=Coniosporium uncinatum TaxID=93489 RepID=A0ACC3D945_9PEZI|nr:hypothetical protein LTS18_013414 [Coniosporium uncinatum]